MSDLRPLDAWRNVSGAITLLLLLTLFLYQQTIVYLMEKWSQLDGDYGHGYLVLLISAYMIFHNRRRLMAVTPCPERRAILALIAASMFSMVASLVDIEVLQPVGLLLILLSIIWLMLGTQALRLLVLPILFIGFAIPVWFPLLPVLQELTTDVVFWAVRIMNIPALRIDNMIVLPSGKLSVEETCSGLRYLMAALTLGVLFAYLNYVTFSARLIVVLVVAGAAVLANILRVFIVVYLGYRTDMQHPLISDHVTFGWYIFAGMVVILLVVDMLIHRVFLHDTNEIQETVVHDLTPCNKVKSQLIVTVLSGVLLVSAGPIIIYWIKSQPQSKSYPVQIMLAVDAGEWSVIDDVEDDWAPQFRGAVDHKLIFQDKSNREIHLYLGMYPDQKQGEELIYDSNTISGDRVWSSGYQRAKRYNVGGQLVLEQLLEKEDGSQRLVWYWYHVAGQDTVSEYQAKALQVLGFLIDKRQASIVAIAAELDGEPDYTRERLGLFVEKVAPSLIRAIDNDK